MIELTTGNLLDADAEALVNTVNCVGVMGKGIALEFKRRYPKMFSAYALACKRSEVQVGRMWVYTSTNAPTVICFPTKQHWRNPSQLEWITTGLDDLRSRVTMNGIRSIALPALGCANGGLNFAEVKPLIYEKLNDLDARIILYEPQ